MMKSAQKHPNELERLKSLDRLKILDTLPEKDFDDLTLIASQICDAPIALISLVDESRQWFKSKVGLSAEQTPPDLAFCAHAILQNDVFIIPDSSQDERFADNPLVVGNPHVVFYAGVPIISEGYPIGTLCVIDHKPRQLSQSQTMALTALKNQVQRLLEMRMQIEKIKLTNEKLEFKRTALENISEGVCLQDADGKIIDFNSAACAVLGLTADQLTGKTSMDPDWKAIREDGADFPGHEHPAMVALKTGQSQINKLMGVRRPNQELRWLQVNAIPLFADSANLKKVTSVAVSFADITLQKETQQKLFKNQKDLKRILDGVPAMIGHWDKNLINVRANQTYYDYFGKDPESIKGLHMRDLLGEKVFDLNLPYIKAALQGKTQTFQREIATPHGETRHVVATYLPDLENGEVAGFLVIDTDITEIKKFENDRREMESRLIESSRLSTLGEMAAGIAHEINNPLAIIQAKSLNIKRKVGKGVVEPEILVQDLQKIEDTVSRITKIINGLRSFSRDSKDDLFTNEQISKLLDETMSLCAERFNWNGVKLNINQYEDTGVECRPAQISQVLMNLLSNAYDAVQSLPDKWINVEVQNQESGIVSISVTDSGNGISQKIVEKMMQPFFTTKEVGKGTGLGLSISKGIIESHGGRFYYDEKSKNTRFVIELPKVHHGQKTRAA